LSDRALQPTDLLKQGLGDSFLLFKPKDIVSGDFYWLETTKSSSPPNLGGVAAGRGGQKPHENHPTSNSESHEKVMNLPHLKTFRKALRNNLTPSEAKLWSILNKSQLEGRKFRRQHSVDNYILDFYCPSEKLAIELDGEGHNDIIQAEYDLERDLFLNSYGIKVLRFENKMVFEQTEAVLSEIKKGFGWCNHPGSASHPSTASASGGVQEEEEVVYFAVADCTGHGVPGAMMTVMCSNALTRCVQEMNITEPAKILDATTKIIESRFKRSGQLVLDGMDLALCSLNRKTLELGYAGANNPLWIIKAPGSEKAADSVRNLIEVKADKQPIGMYDYRKPYTNHKIQLEKGDTIYLFSDGYVDQFGGDKGKKFKSKPFKSLLLSIQAESMDRQKELIDQALTDWQGDIEQVDDICIIGVKV